MMMLDLQYVQVLTTGWTMEQREKGLEARGHIFFLNEHKQHGGHSTSIKLVRKDQVVSSSQAQLASSWERGIIGVGPKERFQR